MYTLKHVHITPIFPSKTHCRSNNTNLGWNLIRKLYLLLWCVLCPSELPNWVTGFVSLWWLTAYDSRIVLFSYFVTDGLSICNGFKNSNKESWIGFKKSCQEQSLKHESVLWNWKNFHNCLISILCIVRVRFSSFTLSFNVGTIIPMTFSNPNHPE